MAKKKSKKRAVIKSKVKTKQSTFIGLKYTQKESFIVAGIMVFFSFLLYFQSIGFGYILDDQIVITDNQYTQKGFSGISDIFTKESFAGYFGEQKNLVQGARYRPLSIASFAIENGLFGADKPGISHFINILLYALVGWVLFIFLSKLYSSPHKIWFSIPFIASIVYVFHPLHTEAVANIKGRDEIMTFLFVLLASIQLLNWIDYGRLKSLFLSCCLFLLALLAKENAITFLGVLPVTIYIFRNKNLKQALFSIWPWLLTTVIYLMIRVGVVGYLLNSELDIQDLMNNPFLEMSTSQKYATISFTLWKYLGLSFFPHPLAHDYYPYAIPILDWSDIRAYGSLLIYMLLIGLSLWTIFKKKKEWYGLPFYLITLTIVSNIFINVGTFMNERFLFISSAGICILIAAAANWGMNKGYKLPVAVMVGLLCIGYGMKTMLRVPDWQSAIALNESAVEVNPGSARANSFMATALYNQYVKEPNSEEKNNAMEQAYEHVKQAINVVPRYRNAQLMKAGISSELYKSDKNLSTLLQRFREVVQVRPDIDFVYQYTKYLEGKVDPQVLVRWYYDTGYKDLFQNKKYGNASLNLLLPAHRMSPTDDRILRALVEVYEALGNTAEADKYLAKLNG